MCTNTFFLEKGAVMDQAMKAYLGDVPQFSYNSKKPKEAEVSLKRKAIRIILNIMIHTSNGRTTCYTTNWHSTTTTHNQTLYSTLDRFSRVMSSFRKFRKICT